jgi:hypothetical protein
VTEPTTILSCFSITLKLIASWEVVEYVTVTLISVVAVVSWASSSMILIDVLMGVFVGASDGDADVGSRDGEPVGIGDGCSDGDCVGRAEVGSPVG